MKIVVFAVATVTTVAFNGRIMINGYVITVITKRRSLIPDRRKSCLGASGAFHALGFHDCA